MASVKQAWIRKYGEEQGLRKYEEYKKTCGRTNEQLKAQYGEQYVADLVKKKSIHSLDACIRKYGEVDGPIKWQERLSKKIETQRQKRESGHRYKNGRTLEEYQERYGMDEGYKRWKKRNNQHSYRFSKQFYIDTYGLENGISRWELYKETMNKTSLTAFQNRYGDEDGLRRYNERCKKCAITEHSMILKYGEEIGRLKYNEWLLKVTQTSANLFARGYSKISQKLFHELYELLDIDYQENSYYAELNQEYQFFVNHENNYPHKIIRVDYKCGTAIIEFDGQYWHNAELDKQRDVLLESKGYRILRISDLEYKENKEAVINKCKEFIYENARLK